MNGIFQGERRVGKTSLVLDTVAHMRGVSLLHADFLCVRDTADFCRRLASALARTEKSAGFLEKTVRALARLRPTLTVDVLWDITEKGDRIESSLVRVALQTIFAREQDHYEIFIRRLTALQTRVLRALAVRGGREVCSIGFLRAAESRSVASVKRAIDKLLNDGLVYYHENEYRLVSPFLGAWIGMLGG